MKKSHILAASKTKIRKCKNFSHQPAAENSLSGKFEGK